MLISGSPWQVRLTGSASSNLIRSMYGCQDAVFEGSTQLRIADCGLRIADCGLRIADCGLRIINMSGPKCQVKWKRYWQWEGS